MGPLEPDDPAGVGPYRLLARLGAGAMGLVYLGVSRGGRPVAVKTVRPELAADPAFRQRFAAEIAAARAVSGAFTTPLQGADATGPTPWLATAYVAGPSLQEAIERFGPMPEPTLRVLGAGLAEAVMAIHRAGLIHRDLKPSNILLAADGPRVIDFGITHPAGQAADGAVGSAGYMAPDQMPAPPGDVFSLGAVLAFAATGRPPFGRGPARVLMYRAVHERPRLNGVPPALAGLVAECLDRDPARRPAVARLPWLLAPPAALPHWLPQPVDADLHEREETLAEALAARRRVTRRRLLVTGGGLAAAAAVGGTLAAVLGGGGKAKPRTPRFLWSIPLPEPHMDLAGIAGSHYILEGSNGGVAYDVATGHATWNDTGSGDVTNPIVDGPDLYVARSGRRYHLDEIDGASGAVRWSFFATTTPFIPFDVFDPTVIDRDTVYAIESDHILRALDRATGKLKWSWGNQTSNNVTMKVTGLFGDDIVGSYDGGNEIFVLSAADGTVRWKRNTGLAVLTATSSLVVTGTTGKGAGTVSAVRLSDGSPVWQRAVSGQIDLAGSATVTGNVVTFTAGTTLWAMNVHTGRTAWQRRIGQYAQYAISGPRLFLMDGRLSALDVNTGRRLWSSTMALSGNSAGPAFLGDLAVVFAPIGLNSATKSWTLYGWDLETGGLAWRYAVPVGNPNSGQVDLTGDRLALLHDQTLLAFRLS